MNKKIDNIFAFSKKIRFEYDSGLISEIHSFIEYKSTIITDSNLKFDDVEKKLCLTIVPKKFNSKKDYVSFSKELISFIEYNFLSIHMFQDKGTHYELTLLSCREDKVGFLLVVHMQTNI